MNGEKARVSQEGAPLLDKKKELDVMNRARSPYGCAAGDVASKKLRLSANGVYTSTHEVA